MTTTASYARYNTKEQLLPTPALPPMKKIAAIYARFSTDNQKTTSVEDQVRNCLALARARGYEVPPELIFTDEAVSGDYRKLDKRTGWAAFNAAWDAGKFNAILADEVSRLARDDVELPLLKRRVLTSGVHLLTLCGTDSSVKGWELTFGFKSLMAVHALAEYAQRTRRGMLGAVLRGYQVGTPPFGYRAVKVVQGSEVLGTKFEIVEDEARWVREAFELRASGKSLNEIATHFNRNAVPPRSKSRPGMAYWRAAQVRMLLSMPFYAGYFMFPVRDEATGRTTDKRFEREELRLVSDALFEACAVKKGAKFTAIRGSVSHYLAGLVRCGTCGNVLRLQHDPKRNGPAMRCAQCECRVSSGVEGAKAPYVSTVGLDLAVRDAVASALTPEVADLFRARLMERLTGGVEAELAQHRAHLDKVKSSLARVARLLSTLDRDDLTLEAEYRRLLSEEELITRKLVQLTPNTAKVDKEALKRQLAIDPAKLIKRVFSGDPAALGARLRRFFSSITLEDKPDRFTAVFSLCLVPGAIASELTGTSQVDAAPVCLRYTVKQQRVAGGKVEWKVVRHP